MDGITKKQHYVPQCYLKAWKINRKNQIYVYDKEKKESRINNIEDVASEKYFYDFTPKDFLSKHDIDALLEDTDGFDADTKIQIIEKTLSISIEKPYAELISKILRDAKVASNWVLKNCYFLRPEFKESFSGLLAVQYVRTAHVRNMIRDISDNINQFVAKIGASDQVLKEYKTLTKEESKNIHIGMMLQDEHLSEMAFYFNRLKWVLGINRTDKKFWTSDNPICLIPHCSNGPLKMNGLASKGIEVILTLSPDCILIMRDGDYHKAFVQKDMNYNEIKDQNIIEAYNAYIFMQADRSVFSVDNDYSLIERLKTKDSRLIQVAKPTLYWGDVTIQSRV